MIVLLLCLISVAQCNLTGGGFGAAYSWVDWSEAKTLAAQQDKPIMVLLHKTWCGACKNLRPKFANSKDILRLSESFIMVNAEDNEAPSSEAEFSIDGGYIPRIVFLDSAGLVRPEFINKNRPDKYSYFYPSAPEILDSMDNVLKSMKSKQEL